MTEGKLAFGDTNDLARKIREALGVEPYEEVSVTLPQFDRTDGINVVYFPKTSQELDRVKTLKKDMLRELGLRPWDDMGVGVELWLFPAEWYDFIPNDYEVVDINGGVEKFKHGKTDNDRRFGLLSYGFLRDISKP